MLSYFRNEPTARVRCRVEDAALTPGPAALDDAGRFTGMRPLRPVAGRLGRPAAPPRPVGSSPRLSVRCRPWRAPLWEPSCPALEEPMLAWAFWPWRQTFRLSPQGYRSGA